MTHCRVQVKGGCEKPTISEVKEKKCKIKESITFLHGWPPLVFLWALQAIQHDQIGKLTTN